VTGTTSGSQFVTLSNTGNATLTGVTLSGFTAEFQRGTGTQNCSTTVPFTLAQAGSCRIYVTFTPGAAGTRSGSLGISATNATVTGSPVNLSGTGVAPVVSASLTPTSWTPTQTRNCPGTGILGQLACAADPTQGFTLTNTGNVPLTGIAQAVLGGANVADYTVVRLLSTCGPAGNGQVTANTTLAPGATCTVRVAFRPRTAEAPGTKSATISVTDLAGTQSATLSGDAQ
jgi:hypothetical protein